MRGSGGGFEFRFDGLKPGRTLLSKRGESFDEYHGMFYSPLYCEEVDAPKIVEKMPSDEWIDQAFHAFVRDEFGARQSPVSVADLEGTEKLSVSFDEFAVMFRDRVERSYVYGGYLDEVIHRHDSADMTGKLFGIICDKWFGNEKNRELVTYEEFERMLSDIKVGMRLVVPGLPFRDQNMIRTHEEAGNVSLAEVAFLVRLHCIALALYQVLPPGADVVVLSDGRLYANILGVCETEAARYFEEVRRIRSVLNIAGTVSILDLKRMVELYDNKTGIFWRTVSHIKGKLSDIRKGEASQGRLEAFEAIEAGIRWNFNTRGLGVDGDEIGEWLIGRPVSPRVPLNGRRLPTVEEIASRATEYTAVNLALRWHDVVARMMPTAVRATMHPKTGQLALPRFGSCFPWNGVAISTAREPMDVEIHSLAEAARRTMLLREIADNTGRISFYQRMK